MKNIINAVLALLLVPSVLSLSGCGSRNESTSSDKETPDTTVSENTTTVQETTDSKKPENTAPDKEKLDAYYETNRFDSIFTRHNNVFESNDYYVNGNVEYNESYYLDNDLYYCKASDGMAAIFSKDLSLYLFDDETPNKQLILYDDKQYYEQYYYDYRNSGLFNLPETEELTETIEEDGEFIAITEENTKDAILNDINYYNLPEDIFEYEDGMKLRLRYIIDSNTTDLKKLEHYIIDSEGNSTLFLITEYTFDVDKFDYSAEGEACEEYFKQMEENDTYNLTLVFSPETDNEHSVMYTIPHNTPFSTFYNDENVEHYYLDKECTEEYVSDEQEQKQELTLYIK